MRLVSILSIVGLLACGSSSDPGGETIRVTIPPGATVAIAADSLATRGVIRSARYFKILARVTGHDRSVQAGIYDMSTGLSTAQALDILVRGRTALDRLVIPEGLMLTELAATVEQQLGVPAESILASAQEPYLLQAVGARGPTLEGYLFPTTYMFRIGVSAREIVDRMVTEFEAQWDASWNARLDSVGFSRDEIVTLASIIEGEARHAEDLGYVASVYHNRLRRGMRLQADPTVIYALGRRRRLFQRDYAIQSPYNTYQVDGLPPHPIGQPSRPSLEAALYPRPSDFLFFVAGADGRHIFSRTYREHLAAIRRIRGA